jgi:hypothetical protein
MKKILPILLIVLFSVACVSSALSMPTPSAIPDPTKSQPTPLPSPTPSPTVIKLYDNYTVTAHALEVRAAPGERSENIGYLERDSVVTVYEVKETTSEKCLVWARIGVDRWVCMDRLERVD